MHRGQGNRGCSCKGRWSRNQLGGEQRPPGCRDQLLLGRFQGPRGLGQARYVHRVQPRSLDGCRAQPRSLHVGRELAGGQL